MAVTFVTEAFLDALGVAVASRYNTLKGKVGDTTALTTTVKTSVVAAINEVKASMPSGGAVISDGTTATGTVWSSQKVSDAISAAVSGILGSASAAYDTLQEIQAQLQSDDTDISGILTALGNRLRFDQAQTLTGPQQTQALANLGITISTLDVAAAFTAATA
jgi:hypothetical protein